MPHSSDTPGRTVADGQQEVGAFGIPPGLHEHSRRVMESMGELGILDAEAETVADFRALSVIEQQLMTPAPAVESVEDEEIPGPGGSIGIRMYRPSAKPTARIMLWLHGGGWCVGDLDLADIDCRRLSICLDALVVSVDYRLAPEHPFPAGLEDAYAALGWVENRLRPRLAPGDLPLLVGGDSAGGNLAAALCLKVKEQGGPAIDQQLLVYPVTDHSLDTRSHDEFAEGYLLGKEDMRFFWDHYAPDPQMSQGPLASVLHAPDLAGLPPATVVIAACDVLRDEGEAFAGRLGEASVATDVLSYPGQLHGFWSFGGVSEFPYEVDRDIAASLARPIDR